MAALLSVASTSQAQTAPTNAQLIDQILAKTKPGDKLVRSYDILFEIDKLRAMRGQTGGGKQTASAFYRTTFWPEGKVAYVFDPTLQPAQRTFFVEAARELETYASLKFTPRTTETNYIRVFRDTGDPNYSQIGQVGGEQQMSLGIFSNRYTAAHEIMHALGIMHEQSRSDRDNFVSIDFTNIEAGQEGNFAIVPNSNNRSAYDFDSVMHYGQDYFAKDPAKPTITVNAPNQQFQTRIGQRDHVSESDKKGLADIYGPPGVVVRPSNDFFARAQTIEGPSGSVEGFNSRATSELGEPAHAGSPAASSVWYRWRPTTGGTVTFTTQGSSFDTVLAVYLGLSVSTITNVTSNDDVTPGALTPAAGLTSSVTFPAQANATYYIAVDGATSLFSFNKNGETGNIALNWNQDVDASRTRLSGVVKTSAGQVLSGVTINLTGAESSNRSTMTFATTNKNGEYVITSLLPGSYNLRASKAAFTFEPSTRRVRVTGASTGNDFTATAIPEDQLPELFVSDVSVREGKSNASSLNFNVSLRAPSKDTVTVEYTTTDGTAKSGGDYNGAKGTLSFAPGTTTLRVTVTLRPDNFVEPDESFFLQILNAVGARIIKDRNKGTATLVDDDLAR